MRAPVAPLLAVMFLAVSLAGCLSTDGDDLTAEGLQVPSGVAFGSVSGIKSDSYSVFPGDYLFDEDVGSQPLREALHEALPVVSQALTSDLDGATIDLSYWLPDSTEAPDAEPVPVIVQASPYFPRTDAPSGSQDFGQWMHDVFVPRGYAYVQLAIRSTGASGGCDDFRGPHMNADLDQAMTWLAEQAWSNGNIALIGKSYPGSTPWYAAGTGNPHIKTIVPVSGSTNAWEVYNRNGTPESRSPIIVPNYGVSAATNGERDPDKKAENFACTEVYEGWAYGVGSGATAERLDDDWWDARNAKPAVEANYDGSVLLVHGLEDWNVDPAVALPWTDQLDRSGLHVKHFLGQWAHDHPDRGSEETLRWDWAEVLDRWFRYWLMEETDLDLGPPVQVQSNDGRWRDEFHWPPHDAEPLRLYLTDDGLATGHDGPGDWHVLVPGSTATREAEERTELASPAFPGPLATAFTYTYGPLEEPMHVAGLPKVHLDVTPDGPGGYFGAFLYDESPDGERTRIGWTGMNLRYAHGGEEPKDVTPFESLVAKAQIQPMDAYLPAGHTLILVINTDAPPDRVPPASQPFDVPIQVGGTASVLELPVVARGAEAFFTPPMPQ